MFYPGSDHFLIPDPDPTTFSSRILHENWNANLFFVLLLMLSGKVVDPHPAPDWIQIQ
jgi:hypothetical protein